MLMNMLKLIESTVNTRLSIVITFYKAYNSGKIFAALAFGDSSTRQKQNRCTLKHMLPTCGIE